MNSRASMVLPARHTGGCQLIRRKSNTSFTADLRPVSALGLQAGLTHSSELPGPGRRPVIKADPKTPPTATLQSNQEIVNETAKGPCCTGYLQNDLPWRALGLFDFQARPTPTFLIDY